jgi:hypothetical protein
MASTDEPTRPTITDRAVGARSATRAAALR